MSKKENLISKMEKQFGIENLIVKYIKKGINNKNVGVIVAFSIERNKEKQSLIGYSLCRKTDTFDKEFGIKLAIGRASKKCERCYIMTEKSFYDIPNEIVEDTKYYMIIPASIWKDFEEFFLNRYLKYFKDCKKLQTLSSDDE